MTRVLAWVSGGAASMIAARMAIAKFGGDNVLMVRCETGNEDEDNARFEADCEAWIGKKVTVLKSDEYESCEDVWTRHHSPLIHRLETLRRWTCSSMDAGEVFHL